MDTEARLKQAVNMFTKSGYDSEFSLYLQQLKEEDPLAHSMIEVYIHAHRHEFPVAVRKGSRIISRVSGKPGLAWLLFMSIGMAYRGMGELETAENYFLRALDALRILGDKKNLSRINFQISVIRFSKTDYKQAHKDFLSYKKEFPGSPLIDFYLGLFALIAGELDKAIKYFDCSALANAKSPYRFSIYEVKALALRFLGRFPEAMKTLCESAEAYINYGSAYSAFPVAKALQLSRLAGLEPPPASLIRKALKLAKKGSWGELAAAEEIEALLREDDADAAEGLYEAAKNYLKAYQNIEAVLSGLAAAWLAWRTENPVFIKSLKLIGHLLPLHPGLKKDPLLGDFMAGIEPFIAKALKPVQNDESIRAYLIGELRVFVEGKDISLTGWRRKKAINAFLYLLLSPNHRIPVDHLFYLLWPRREYIRKNRYGLYTAINTIRRNLGNPALLIKRHDFYQLENVRTDLGELEDLVRLADAMTDPAQREEYLARARELAKGELLPEFPYDKHIDEYRQYYERLRRRILGE
jgi:hypothetical protein